MLFVPGILTIKDTETSICVLVLYTDFAFFHDENFCIKISFQDSVKSIVKVRLRVHTKKSYYMELCNNLIK